MDRARYVAANRAAWEASAPLHRRGASWQRLAEGFARPGFSCLDAVETEALTREGVAGKAVAQLCCNNARELLSVKSMGAGRCVGFDQADAFLEQGRELAEIAGLELELVSGDVYAVPARFDAAFEIVLVTIGVFGWLPDLPGFFAVAARLLRPGGLLVVHEQHPITNLFEVGDPDPFALRHSYFRPLPFEERQAVVYDGSATPEVAPYYWFVHPLGDTVTAALEAGLRLERLREYPDNISSVEYDVLATRPGVELPLSYLMTARQA